MNKKELIHAIAKQADVSLIEAGKCLNAFLKITTRTLAKKESITLVGFGTFSTKKRAFREGRNPKTGESVKIKATSVPKFKPGKKLKSIIKAK